MVKTMRDSNLYIAIEAKTEELTISRKEEVHKVFEEIFESSFEVVSDVTESDTVEVVYSIRTPIVKDDVLAKEFYENLEILLEELEEYYPHFTQFNRGGKYA